MKVLFVYPNIVRHPVDISAGLAILAACSKEHGYEVELLDTSFGKSDTEIVCEVRGFNPDIIAMSSTSANIDYAEHVAKLIKKAFRTPLIIGGVHPTVAPEDTLGKDCFDMICVGEGEGAFLELLDSIKKGEKNTTIRNIGFKENGKMIINPLRPIIEDLDSLPIADYGIYDYERYLESHVGMASFLCTRGCPYKCTYCINRFNQNIYKGLGKFIRYRGDNKIIEEIKAVINAYPVKGINFEDDTFTLKKSKVKSFSKLYKKEIGLPFTVNARIETLNDDVCSDLAQAGCTRMQIGLESGDPVIRKEVLNRNISDEQIINASAIVKKYGIQLYTFNMIGIPGETKENIEKTIALNRRIQPDFMAVSIFAAYQGTAMYDKCKEQGILDESKPLHTYYNSSNVRHPDFTLDQLRRIRRWFGFRVFIAFNLKRAIIEMIDRHLININYYSKIRSFLITRVINKGKT